MELNEAVGDPHRRVADGWKEALCLASRIR
jgi:hypothetical protein